jgi:hypothetical protein
MSKYLYYWTWNLFIILLLYVWMKHPGYTYGGFVPAISERGMTWVRETQRRGARFNSVWTETKIQTRPNWFQNPSNFDYFKQALPGLQKFEAKYGFEDLREMNNFLYSNFSRFGMEMELKFRQSCMSWNQGIFDWKFLGTSNLMKLGQQLPLYTLLKGKINSKQIGVKNFKSPWR